MNKPFIPVHHIRGHIAATYLAYPELKTAVFDTGASGGHSEIVMVKATPSLKSSAAHATTQQARRSDKVARVLGVGYPGGLKIDKLAQDGDAKMYKLPDSHIKDAPLDFSFRDSKRSSILAHNAEQKGKPSTGTVSRPRSARLSCIRSCRGSRWPSSRRMRGALCVRAAWQPIPSCGRPLQDMAKREHVQLFMPPLQLCGDNAAMIGSQAYYEYQAGTRGKTLQNAYATADIGKNICD